MYTHFLTFNSYLYTNVSTVHPTVYERDIYPKAVRPFLPEIRAWTEHNHFNILHPLLRYVWSYPFIHFNASDRQTAEF